MIETQLLLFFEFFKTGLLTFGGGLSSIPFLFEMSQNYSWFTSVELTQMIAISSITPGPIGLNMATYSGYKTLGILGAIISSLAIIFPMVIITSQVYRLYDKFNQNKYVLKILYILRPTTCALVCYVGIKLFYHLILNSNITLNNIDYKGLIILLILFLMTFKIKNSIFIYFIIALVLGTIFNNFT